MVNVNCRNGARPDGAALPRPTHPLLSAVNPAQLAEATVLEAIVWRAAAIRVAVANAAEALADLIEQITEVRNGLSEGQAGCCRELLLASEVAKLVRLPRETILEMADRGEIPTIRIGAGHLLRFPAAEVEAWLAGRPEPADGDA